MSGMTFHGLRDHLPGGEGKSQPSLWPRLNSLQEQNQTLLSVYKTHHEVKELRTMKETSGMLGVVGLAGLVKHDFPDPQLSHCAVTCGHLAAPSNLLLPVSCRQIIR